MDSQTPRERALQQGLRSYGHSWQADVVVEAPGRLELLGNHVDYNGGLVLAGAIDRVVAVALGGSASPGEIELVAGDVSLVTTRISVDSCQDWRKASGSTHPADYACGVVAAMLDRGLDFRTGAQIAISGNVPLGFGMSSSAGLCVALVMALSVDSIEPREVVMIAREAEHRCGNPVGAMDQSASVAGGIILFNGAALTFDALQPDLGDYVFAVADSGVSHALGDSSYPVRVRESQEALGVLRNLVGKDLDALGELQPDQWNAIRQANPAMLTPTLTRRVDHVVSEVDRVRQGVGAIHAGDWAAFGHLMTESGRSSAESYEISHPLVEDLVRQLLLIDGVLGARMMGGGEGGPALALIHRNAIPDAAASLERGFFRHHPSHLDGDRLQTSVFGPGARIVS